MSYVVTSLGQKEFNRVERVFLNTENIGDADYVKYIILETIDQQSVQRFSDLFPHLAIRGFRTPNAAKFSRGIFTFLQDRDMIENRA